MARSPALFLCLLSAGSLAPAFGQPNVKLKPATLDAFERYVASVESDLNRRVGEPKPFLWIDDTPANRNKLRGQQLLTRRIKTEEAKVPDGLIHDWAGVSFFPGATADNVIAFLQDINRHAGYYSEVLEARLLSRQGDRIRSSLRLRKKKVITVELNTEHESVYRRLSGKRWYVMSHSTRIAQVKDPGAARETELPVGQDGGFLWRVNVYWRIDEVADGTYVEIRTLSLTRGIPFGVGWIVKPFVTSIPEESLASTLEGTRRAVLAGR